MNNVVAHCWLENCQVDFKLVVHYLAEKTREYGLHQDVILASDIMPMSGWSYGSHWIFVYQFQGLSLSTVSKVWSIGSNPREEDSVDMLRKGSLLTVLCCKDDFLHKLAFNPGNSQSTFRVVSFANYDAVISRQIIVFFIRSFLLSK